jgi:hypothetical protein
VPSWSVTPQALRVGPSVSQSHTVVIRSSPEPGSPVLFDRSVAAGGGDVGAHLGSLLAGAGGGGTLNRQRRARQGTNGRNFL